MPGPFTSVHTVSWDANTEPDLAGYRIYAGRTSGVYGSAGTPIQVTQPLTSGTVILDGSGTWYFAVTAFDDSNNESGFSTEVARNYVLLGNF